MSEICNLAEAFKRINGGRYPPKKGAQSAKDHRHSSTKGPPKKLQPISSPR